MELIQSIRQWWSEQKKSRQIMRAAKVQSRREQMSCEIINVMEFNGKLYVSHNGAPIVPIDNLNVEISTILAQSRRDYLAWIEKFNDGKF